MKIDDDGDLIVTRKTRAIIEIGMLCLGFRVRVHLKLTLFFLCHRTFQFNSFTTGRLTSVARGASPSRLPVSYSP